MDTKIDSIIESIKVACIKISEKVSNNNPQDMSGIIGSNNSDDEVKKLDILSNKYLIEELSNNPNVKTLASEENSSLINLDNKGEYLVTFDPLDGSSNIDSNITIGTIFGIFINEDITDKKLGDSIIAAGYCLYGGSTQLIYTKKSISSLECYILKRDNDRTFIKINNIMMPPKGKTYSINECNKYKWKNNEKYVQLIDNFIDRGYTQRWVGSLVADAHRTIIKGGYFSYPIDKNNKCKLRLLYEAIPYCFIVEKAGGKCYLDDEMNDWKETCFPEDIHQKVPLILMSAEENEIVKSFFI